MEPTGELEGFTWPTTSSKTVSEKKKSNWLKTAEQETSADGEINDLDALSYQQGSY